MLPSELSTTNDVMIDNRFYPDFPSQHGFLNSVCIYRSLGSRTVTSLNIVLSSLQIGNLAYCNDKSLSRSEHGLVDTLSSSIQFLEAFLLLCSVI